MSFAPNDGAVRVLVAGLGNGPLDWWKGHSPIRPAIAQGQAEAMRVARQEEIDVAVVNWKLADGDGMILVSLLKELSPHLMVIVTGKGQEPGEELEAYASGASLFLPQPLDAAELARVIATCLNRTDRLSNAMSA